MNWQPIEICPLRTEVLLIGEAGDIGLGFSVGDRYWRFVDADGYCDDFHKPTHWMPLPELPK